MARLKPTPITTEQICSVCDLDWDDHPDDASVEDCINLLKANNAKQSSCCGGHYHWHYTYPYQGVISNPVITWNDTTGGYVGTGTAMQNAGITVTNTAELTTGGE